MPYSLSVRTAITPKVFKPNTDIHKEIKYSTSTHTVHLISVYQNYVTTIPKAKHEFGCYWKPSTPTSHETTAQVALLQVIRGLQHCSGGPGAVQNSAFSEWGPNCRKTTLHEHSNSTTARNDGQAKKNYFEPHREVNSRVQGSVSDSLNSSHRRFVTPPSPSRDLPSSSSWGLLHKDFYATNIHPSLLPAWHGWHTSLPHHPAEPELEVTHPTFHFQRHKHQELHTAQATEAPQHHHWSLVCKQGDGSAVLTPTLFPARSQKL